MKKVNIFSLSLTTVLLLFCVVGQTMAQNTSNINPNYWYRLTNMWKGESLSLAVNLDGKCNCQLQLAKTAETNEQLWKIKPTQNGWYRIIPRKQGKSICLGLKSDNNTPQVAECGKYIEQLWQFISNNDGHFFLHTKSQGGNRVLDIMNDGKNSVLLGEKKGYSGQLWKLTKVRPIETQPERSARNGQVNRNNGQSGTYRRGRSGGSRTTANPNPPTKQVTRSKANNQPDFLKAAPQIQEDKAAPIAKVTPENMIVKGTQLKVSNPPENWESMENPIELKVLEAIVVNGKIQVYQGSNVKANVQANPTRRSPKAVKVKLIGLMTSEGKWMPLETDELIVNHFSKASTENFLYLGSDVMLEVPVETGISFELKEDMVTK